MNGHTADPGVPRPEPHHYMNADGFCHAGDMFEAGTDYVVLYSAEELVRIVNAEKAEAWDEGHAASERDWEFTFDITTPDEERRPLTNHYREHLK